MFPALSKASREEQVAPCIKNRALVLFKEQQTSIYKRTDRLFAGLFLLQFVAVVLWALITRPGAQGQLQVFQFAALDALFATLPLIYIIKKPGRAFTRQIVALAQMLCSGLIIAISGGSPEAHSHVFCSLAFLAFYRDSGPLITASIITTLDHILRGSFLPATIYGTIQADHWRWMEHAFWVMVCDTFLILSIRQSLKDMQMMAFRQAELEASKSSIEQEVVARTAELKRSEQNLRDSEATTRAIFETAADSIVTITESGQIESANQTCEKMFGCHVRQICGKHISVLIEKAGDEHCTPDSWPKLREQSRFRHDALRLEGTGKSRSRGMFPIEVSLSHIDLKGRKLITAIIRDCSERKEAEKRVSEFYSIVSHELRTPLTSIRGSLGLIEGGLTGILTIETRELVGIARESCDRLIRLINDILDLKKLESGKFEFHKSETSPLELLNMVVAYTSGMAKERGVRIEIGWTTQRKISADNDRINQVLANLISNAIKFSPKSGVVELSATANDDGVRFAVRDQGKGIPISEQLKLFQKFQQLDSSDRRQEEGTGLGLAICKAIVEQHGGKIGLDSAPNNGTTFWFTVPVDNASSFDTENPGESEIANERQFEINAASRVH